MVVEYRNSDWDDAYAKANVLLLEGNFGEAKTLLKKFDSFPYYKKISDTTLRNYVHYKSFRLAYENSDYKAVYHMAGKYEVFKRSDYYLAAEKIWKKNISSILSKLSSGQASKTVVLELLKPFAGIPEKVPMTQLILKHPDVLLRFKNALTKRDFASFFDIASKFPALVNSEEYSTAENMAQNIIKSCEKEIDGERVDKAKQLMDVLAKFPTKKKEYSVIKGKLHILETFHILASTGDYKYFYELADKHLAPKIQINTQLAVIR